MDDMDDIIFVVGSSRSGTTMMGRIVGSHPDVFTFHELHFFEQLWDGESNAILLAREAHRLTSRLLAIQREGYLSNPDPAPYVTEAAGVVDGVPLAPVAVFERFLAYETRRMGCRIACDQTPRNVFYIGEILEQYPRARIVNMVRDPRDVLLSQKRKWRRRYLGGTNIPLGEALRSWVNYHPVTVSRLWVASVQAAARWSSHPRVITARFECLLRQPEETVRTICRFLGIEFTLDLLEIPIIGSSLGADRPESRGIDAARAQPWRKGGLEPAEIRICERISDSAMRMQGYEPEMQGNHRIAVAVHYARFPVKLGAALLLNRRRMKHLGKAVRRRLVPR